MECTPKLCDVFRTLEGEAIIIEKDGMRKTHTVSRLKTGSTESKARVTGQEDFLNDPFMDQTSPSGRGRGNRLWKGMCASTGQIVKSRKATCSRLPFISFRASFISSRVARDIRQIGCSSG